MQERRETGIRTQSYRHVKNILLFKVSQASKVSLDYLSRFSVTALGVRSGPWAEN